MLTMVFIENEVVWYHVSSQFRISKLLDELVGQILQQSLPQKSFRVVNKRMSFSHRCCPRIKSKGRKIPIKSLHFVSLCMEPRLR